MARGDGDASLLASEQMNPVDARKMKKALIEAR